MRTRSRKSRTRKQRKNNVFRKIRKTTVKVLPVLRNVGEIVVVKTAPVVNKGLDGIYGTLATGFDMGIKRIKGKSRRRK